ncbi:MAG: tetratricopeptide repeat protein, partial [Planctomycetes bacterium]|nr:tetratricopeptide repeat protein [Planctomycetota bacterium]
MRLKQSWRTAWNAAVVVTMLGLCLGCASTAKVTLQARVQPKHDTAGIKKIAVLDLESDPTFQVTGSQFSSKITDEIITYRHYEVIERSSRDKILAEQGFQQSAVVDEASAVQAGKLLGVDGLIFGKVDACRVEAVEGTRSVARPSYYGGPPQVVTEPTLVKNGTVAVTARMVNVQTARVAASFSETATGTEPSLFPPAVGATAISRLPSDPIILAKLADKLAKKFAAEVSPHFRPAKRYVIKGKDENTRKGFHLARSGAWKPATRSFEAALQEDPDNGIAHNNLAVCYEKQRDYEKAAQEYEKAIECAPDHKKVQANMRSFSEGTEYQE